MSKAIQSLEEQQAQLKARHEKELLQVAAKLKDAKARERDKERKRETRRKIIVGALVRNHMQKNPDSAFCKQVAGLIDAYVTKSNERELFGLEPVQDNEKTVAQTEI